MRSFFVTRAAFRIRLPCGDLVCRGRGGGLCVAYLSQNLLVKPVLVIPGSSDVGAGVKRLCFKTNWPLSQPKTWHFAVGVNKTYPLFFVPYGRLRRLIVYSGHI